MSFALARALHSSPLNPHSARMGVKEISGRFDLVMFFRFRRFFIESSTKRISLKEKRSMIFSRLDSLVAELSPEYMFVGSRLSPKWIDELITDSLFLFVRIMILRCPSESLFQRGW